jgi:Kef-type K+ transport system membrane component KefB
MEQFGLIIAISTIILLSPTVSQIFKVPVVVVEIFLGMIAGFYGLVYADESLKLISKFGFLYLMFLAGLEINLQLIRTIKSQLSINVAVYFAMLYAIAGAICAIFELGFIYFLAFPIFSLGMLMMLIKEYGKDKPWLNLALALGVVGELVSILALTLFSSWLDNGFDFDFFVSIATIAGAIIAIIMLLKLASMLFWWYPNLRKYIIPDFDRFDQDIRFSVSIFFILIALMLSLKIYAVLGAFVAGLFLKMFFHQKEELIEKLSSFGFGFFVPIFFIYTGSTVNIEMIDMPIIQHALFIIASIVGARLIGSLVAFYSYLKLKQTILFALSDSMPLTFLVAMSMLAYNHQLISQEVYYSFILASMIDGLFLMIVIRRLYKWFGYR